MEAFKKLKLSESILKVIEAVGFKEPTEIQEKTIPLVLQGRDVIGSSATGSGKTLAFGAGIIENVKKGGGVQALVLTPTRELAEQVAVSLRMFSKDFGLNVKEIYGGMSMEPQIYALRNSEIVVGTPGRILDHLDRRTLDLGKVRFLVLDEADRMLEMGFIEDVEKIIKACPKERQTLLFSATIYSDIAVIANKYMKNPARVEVESYVDPSKLKQVFYDVAQDMKFSLLAHLLKEEKEGLVMVFSNTRRNVDVLARNLKRYNIDALAIHGGLSQNKRTSIIKLFHSQKALTLVCTDVAARGLDIKNVSHIYNYDIPKNSTEYIHRIGRTARAGKEGIAVSLVSQRDYGNFRSVCGDGELKIDNLPVPKIDFLPVNFSGGREDRGRGGGGYRGGGRGGYGGGSRGGYGGRSSARGPSRGVYGNREGGRSEGRSGYSRPRFGENRDSGRRENSFGRRRFSSSYAR